MLSPELEIKAKYIIFYKAVVNTECNSELNVGAIMCQQPCAVSSDINIFYCLDSRYVRIFVF